MVMSPDHKQKIAELADKFQDHMISESTRPPSEREWDALNGRKGFQAGAEAALALLAEPQAGHPPRVWIDPECIHKGHYACAWVDDPDDREVIYLSISEHQALRARDAAEIEKLRDQVEGLTIERDGAEKRGLMVLEAKNKMLTTERQARQAAEARVERLKEGLERIIEIGKKQFEGEPGWNSQAMLAREALASLREE